MWFVFMYQSGGNPYIAKTEKERDRILRKYKRMGVEVLYTSENSFTVMDKNL